MPPAPGGYAGQPAGGAGPQAGSGLSKKGEAHPALLLIFLVYDSEYHWRGDLPSLTQGLQDYLGWTDHLEGCAIEALAATEVDGTLYVSFTSDSEDNVHGVAELDRGLN